MEEMTAKTDFTTKLRDKALSITVDKLERYQVTPEKPAKESTTVQGILLSDGAHLTAIFVALAVAAEFVPQPWAAIVSAFVAAVGFLGNKRALEGRRIAGVIIDTLKKAGKK